MTTEISDASLAKLRALPIYDVCVDLHHPATSFATSKANAPINAVIIAPPTAFIEASFFVGKEVVSPSGLEHLARFAFPEFHDQIHAQETARNTPVATDGTSAGLNKYDVYANDFYGLTENKVLNYYPYITASGPTYHSFAMQLSTGDRLFGHVRRYLPKHSLVHGRVDVGRRAARALVILTRHSGGDKFFHSILKTLETAMSLEETMRDTVNRKTLLENFLHSIYHKHLRLCSMYSSSRLQLSAPLGPTDAAVKTNANLISIPLMEFQLDKFEVVDSTRFVIPQTLLHPFSKDDLFQPSASLILPLFRCLGVSNSLRLFSALLCERRIILVSRSPSRLSACGRAAMSILVQGLLHWQHVYIPIVPPAMITYLAAPVPYLIGVLSTHSNLILKVPGLSEVVIFDLDQNKVQVHNMVQDPNMSIPDLLRPSIENPNDYNNGIGVDQFRSPADVLASDLMEILKADKKFLSFGETGVQEVLGNVAEKGKKLLQKGFGKLRGMMASASDVVDDASGDPVDADNHGQDAENANDSASLDEHNFAVGEGSENEAAEEDVRIAFTVFFLNLLGDIKLYVRAPPAGSTTPVFDKNMFLQNRRNLGDREGTPIFQLLNIFKDTQIFEQFVRNRIDDVIMKKPILLDAPLYNLASHFHRNKRIPFAMNEIRQVVRQMSQYNSNRFVIMWTNGVRKRAMAITSNNRDEGNLAPEMKRLVQDCRECTIILVDVMAVLWERLRTCRGMSWKHGLYALQLLRELLLNGPLSAVSDALEGLGKIKKLMKYDNMRSGIAQQIRQAARDVYVLLINRAKLFQLRRFKAKQRKDEESPATAVKKDFRINFTSAKFSVIHSMMKPSGSIIQPIAVADLLNVNVHPNSSTDLQAQTVDFLSLPSAPPTTADSANNLLYAMGNVSLSNQTQAPPSYADLAYNANVQSAPLQSDHLTYPQNYSYGQPQQYNANNSVQQTSDPTKFDPKIFDPFA